MSQVRPQQGGGHHHGNQSYGNQQQQGYNNQQQAMAVPPLQSMDREWSSGLFDCFKDCKTCFMGCLCLCCLTMSVAKRLDENVCVPVCLQGGVMAIRLKLRMKYGIKGTICKDWFATTCCTAFSICQMDRELKQMGLP